MMRESLLEGFRRFRKETYEGADAVMPRLVEDGQAPGHFIISCIDSRSDPGTIFRAGPGTFFAHKAMGAIVRPYRKGTALSASLQFAIRHSGVREIIILGHTGCGAIEALAGGLADEEITSFIDVAQAGLEAARRRCGDGCRHAELLRLTEEEIVLQSATNLLSYPCVAEAMGENRLAIAAWLFDMQAGALLEYDPGKNSFLPITATAGDRQQAAQ